MTYWPRIQQHTPPDSRRRRRSIGLAIMARKSKWRMRHHRAELGGAYEPLPPGWIPTRND